MRKVRLTSKNLQKVDLGDGDWINVRSGLSYDGYKSFSNAAKDDEIEATLNILKSVIVDWNFVDDKEEKIEYKPELIEDLDIETIKFILEKIMPIYMPEKKSLQP